MKKKLLAGGIIAAICILTYSSVFAELLFEESFDGAEAVIGLPVSEWNGWTAADYADAEAEGTAATVAADPTDEDNIALKLVRTSTGSTKKLLEAVHNAEIPAEGYIDFSMRFMPMQESFSVKMLPLVSDMRHDRITCYNGSQMLYSEQEQAYFKVGEWNTVRLRLSNEEKTVEFFVNGNRVGQEMPVSQVPPLEAVSVRMDRNRAPGVLYADDIRVEKEDNPACIEDFVFGLVSNGQKERFVTENLNLSENLTVSGDELEVVWASDNTEVIAADGTVMRGDYDKTVTLTADITVKSSGADYKKSFNVLVPGRGRVIFRDDFDSAAEGTPVATSKTEGYNGWVLDSNNYDKALAENTTTTIEKDPDDESNMAVKLYRENAGTDNSVNINLRAGQKLKLGEAGLLSYNLRFKFTSGSPEFLVKPFINNFGSSSIALNGISGKINLPQSYSDGKWHDLNIIFDYYKQTFDLYLDGVQAIDSVQYPALPSPFDFFSIAQQRSKKGTVYIDDVLISVLDIGDTNAVAEVAEALTLDDLYSENFVLKTEGDLNTKIAWSSADSGVIAIDGMTAVVIRDTEADKQVTITAAVTRGEAFCEKEFTVTVPKMTLFEKELQAFDFSYIGNGQEQNFVTENLNMPGSYETGLGTAKVVWTSDSESVSADGTISRGDYDKRAEITAEITLGGETVTKTLRIVIAAAGTVHGFESFESVKAEGASVDTLSNWTVGTPSDDESVHNVVVKDILSTLEFAEANKALKIERYVNKGSGTPSIQDAKFSFTELTGEIKAFDFDIMLLNDASRLWVRLGDIDKIFIIDKKSITRNGFSATETAFKKEWKLYDWHHVSIVLDSFGGTVDFYIDCEKINNTPIAMAGLGRVSSLSFYSDRISTFNDTVLIDNVRARDITPDSEKAVDSAARDLTIGEINYDTARIELPGLGSCNTKIEWKSSDESVIGTDGVVTRPIGASSEVTLTAVISKGKVYKEKEFTVMADGIAGYAEPTAELLDAAAEDITAELITDEKWNFITHDLTLPTEYSRGKAAEIGGVAIKWTSSNPAVISDSGAVTPPRYDMRVKLTAEVSALRNTDIKTVREITLVAAMNSTLIREYDFDDAPALNYGDNITDWISGFTSKTEGANMEYGVSHFVDKVPGDFGKNNDEANKALYLHRYFTSSMGNIRQDLYTSIAAADNLEMQGSLAISMRVYVDPALKPDRRLKMFLDGIETNNIYVTNNSFEIRNKTEVFSIDEGWHDITFFFDLDSRRMDIFADYEKLNAEPVDMSNAQGYVSRIRFYNDDAVGDILIDDIRIRALVNDYEDRVKKDLERLNLNSSYTEDIVLPTSGRYGSRIVWTSSNEEAVSSGGKIFASSTQNGSATLTALVINGDAAMTKSFNITVPQTSEPDTAYEITEIDIAADIITAKIKGSGPDGSLAVFMLYDKGELAAVKMTGISDGEAVCAVSASEIQCGSVKAFVIDAGNELISNVKTHSFSNSLEY